MPMFLLDFMEAVAGLLAFILNIPGLILGLIFGPVY